LVILSAGAACLFEIVIPSGGSRLPFLDCHPERRRPVWLLRIVILSAGGSRLPF